MAMELSKKIWRLCFGDGKRERQRTVPAGQIHSLMEEIAKAKVKFNMPPNTPVTSCYEAGRDGFWIDRMLHKNGIDNVIQSSVKIGYFLDLSHKLNASMDGTFQRASSSVYFPANLREGTPFFSGYARR